MSTKGTGTGFLVPTPRERGDARSLILSLSHYNYLTPLLQLSTLYAAVGSYSPYVYGVSIPPVPCSFHEEVSSAIVP
jgi:hypothetical protein